MYSIVFLGTPAFAIPALDAVHKLESVEIRAVVTETDKPAGRGQKLAAPPLKQHALSLKLPVLQPKSLKGVAPGSTRDPLPEDHDAHALKSLLADPPDLGITVAYGKILSSPFLSSFRRGVINVHASLLPRWRGAAPLQHAIQAGDAKTGVCIMQTERALDTGPVFHRLELPISNTTTLGSLHDELARLGAQALLESLNGILDASATPEPQTEDGVCYADKWTIADATIQWGESAEAIDRRVRACAPRPGARTTYKGSLLKIFSVAVAPNYSYPEVPAGTIVDVQRDSFVVACGQGEFIKPLEIQLAGKRKMPTEALLRGYTIEQGEICK